MARPKIKKIVDILPLYAYFKPQGIPMSKLKVVVLTLEEVEALKLKDIHNLEQEEAAKKMGISRSTFQRILKSARYKLTDAVIEGKALKVEGGQYIPAEKVVQKQCLMGKHHYYVKKDNLNNHDNNFFSMSNMVCPECGEKIIDFEKENSRNNKKGKNMKICITSTGSTLNASVDPRFGRCPYFIIYDLEQNTFEAIENSSRDAMGGAGIQAGQNIASKNVEAVLSGSFGPNAFRVLQAANIKTYSGVSGTVREAIEQYRKGQLTATSSPDVNAHYGMGRSS